MSANGPDSNGIERSSFGAAGQGREVQEIIKKIFFDELVTSLKKGYAHQYLERHEIGRFKVPQQNTEIRRSFLSRNRPCAAFEKPEQLTCTSAQLETLTRAEFFQNDGSDKCTLGEVPQSSVDLNSKTVRINVTEIEKNVLATQNINIESETEKMPDYHEYRERIMASNRCKFGPTLNLSLLQECLPADELPAQKSSDSVENLSPSDQQPKQQIDDEPKETLLGAYDRLLVNTKNRGDKRRIYRQNLLLLNCAQTLEKQANLSLIVARSSPETATCHTEKLSETGRAAKIEQAEAEQKAVLKISETFITNQQKANSTASKNNPPQTKRQKLANLSKNVEFKSNRYQSFKIAKNNQCSASFAFNAFDSTALIQILTLPELIQLNHLADKLIVCCAENSRRQDCLSESNPDFEDTAVHDLLQKIRRLIQNRSIFNRLCFKKTDSSHFNAWRKIKSDYLQNDSKNAFSQRFVGNVFVSFDKEQWLKKTDFLQKTQYVLPMLTKELFCSKRESKIEEEKLVKSGKFNNLSQKSRLIPAGPCKDIGKTSKIRPSSKNGPLADQLRCSQSKNNTLKLKNQKLLN